MLYFPVISIYDQRKGYMCEGSEGDIGPNISSSLREGMLKNHYSAQKIFSHSTGDLYEPVGEEIFERISKCCS